MGFTSFLSRKPQESQDDLSSFKAQAYGSTIESLPPVLGTNPIPGNGVNAIGSNGIHQLPRKKTKPQLPVSASSISLRNGSASPTVSISSAAPAPLVPRMRSSTISRPNTAHGQPSLASDPTFQSRPKSSGKTRSRRDSLRQSISFLRKSGSQGDLYRLDTQSGSYTSVNAPPVPKIPAAHSPAPNTSETVARPGTASLSLSTTQSLSDSLNRGPGHVDILDAQGEFRPGNFRSRIQAAGARDYGEDVAERNIGVNGVNLSSAAVAEYYATSAQSTRSSLLAQDADLLNRRPRTVNFPRRVDSFESLTSVHDQNREPSSRTRSHQQTLGYGGSGDFQHRPATSSSNKHRPHPLKLQPIVSDSSSSAAEPPKVPRTRTATALHQTRGDIDALPVSPRRPRDSLSLSKPPFGTHSSTADANYPRVPGRSLTRQVRPCSREKGSRMSRFSDQRNGPGDLAVESIADADFASAAPAPDVLPFFRPSDYSAVHMHQIDTARSKSAHGGLRGGHTRSSSRPTTSSAAMAQTYPRTRSLGGLSLHGLSAMEIMEHIPPRISSWRNLSTSSSTPPASASDWSSDRFQRPHSRHTADTSLPPSGSVRSLSLGAPKDMSFRIDAQDFHAFPSYWDDTYPQQSLAAEAEKRMDELIKGKGKEPSRKNWSPHNSDFGPSMSESDYSTSSEQNRFKEESLLFREDGYGHGPAGLPGLFDGRQSPTPSEWSIQTMTYDHNADPITPGGLRPPNTPSAHKAAFAATLPTLPSFDTSSNDGGSDATSEGALDAKLDATMAMRVRRELKRRTRVAIIEKRHGKQAV